MDNRMRNGKHRPIPRAHHRAGLAFLLLALIGLVALPACDRGEPEWNATEVPLPASVEDVDTPQDYAAVRTIELQMPRPRGIALDSEDRLYVAGGSGVVVLDTDGERILSCPTSQPTVDVDVGAEGDIYVALESRVEIFDPSGDRTAAWGVPGEGRGQLSVLRAISVDDEEGDVYLADAGNRCIHHFNIVGDFVDDIGKRDASAGVPGIVCPSPYLDVQVDDQGLVHATNPGRHRVETYHRRGELLDHQGEAGMAPQQYCGCCNPTNLLLLPGGGYATTEKDIPRLKVWSPEGEMLAYIGPDEFSKDAAGIDLALDSQGRIYALDPQAGHIKVFERVDDAANADTTGGVKDDE